MPKPKKNSKKAKAAARASKRRKLSPTDAGEEDHGPPEHEATDNGLGGRKWECVAVSLTDYRAFLATLQRTRDADERMLQKQIGDHILPIVEKAEESLQRKAARKHRELLNMEKLATAKRSSRIAGRAEKLKELEDVAEAERQRQAERIAAEREQEKQQKMEQVCLVGLCLARCSRVHRIARRAS